MRSSKKSTYYVALAAVVGLYVVSYLIIRSMSYSRVDIGVEMSEGGNIALGVWPSDVARVEEILDSGDFTDLDDPYIEKVDRRVKFLFHFYAPLRWFDKQVTKVNI